jgi:hypothetical protein
VSGRIILKLMLEKQVVGVWNGLIWRPFVHDRKSSGSVKGKETVDCVLVIIIFN